MVMTIPGEFLCVGDPAGSPVVARLDRKLTLQSKSGSGSLLNALKSQREETPAIYYQSINTYHE